MDKVRDSIGVSISACHAEDPGSIPGRGVFLCFSRISRKLVPASDFPVANAEPINCQRWRILKIRSSCSTVIELRPGNPASVVDTVAILAQGKPSG
jgi:hypothetical protein